MQRTVKALKIEEIGEVFSLSNSGVKTIAIRVKTDRDIQGIALTADLARTLIDGITRALSAPTSAIGVPHTPGSKRPN